MACLLGIDVGTSACKVGLFDLEGVVLAQSQARYPVHYPRDGWAEQAPEDWWRGVAEALREALKGRDAGDILGIGIAGQSWAAVMVDEAGHALANTPIWMDTRAHEECEEMKEAVGEDRLFQVCGNPVQPAYTLPKILWYRRRLPDVYKRARWVLQSNSFVALRLTGEASHDLSQGYGLHCFDVRRRMWNTDILRELNVPEALLPELSPCHQVIGAVTAEAARLTGLKAGIPVVAGGLDAACGTLGAGVYRAGQAQEQGGQAGGMSICMDRCVADRRLILSQHVVPDTWLLQGGTVGGGGVLRWMSQELCARDGLDGLEAGVGIFEAMSAQAGRVAPGSEGMLFLPYMAGERSPIWNPRAKGVFYGLDYAKTRAHMIRACMEGVAYSLRHNLQTAEEAGATAGVLHAMGGSANSLVWTQMKADVTGCRIEVPSSDMATTLGAAILAGVGVGAYDGFEPAVRRTVRMNRVHLPDAAHKPVYDQGYERYCRLYELLKDMMC